MAQTEDQKILGNLSLVTGMPEEAKARVCALLESISQKSSVGQDEQLLQQDHLGFASGYIVLEGGVKVDRRGMESLELTAPLLLGEMSQFLDDDSRNASVRTTGPVSVLKFSWDDLYERATQELSKEENAGLIDAIEKLVWDRHELQGIADLPLFKDLSDELKMRSCISFPWIGKRVTIPNNEALFEVGSRCKSRGFLLLKGEVAIIWKSGEERTISAPNIIGIMPNHKPERIWSASARAKDEVELMTFSWIEYDKRVRAKLSPDELKAFFSSLQNNAKKHFWS